MSFLDNYETVNQKVIRLHATYPTNRIETSIIDWNAEKGFILIECRIYRRYEDQLCHMQVRQRGTGYRNKT